MKTIKMHGPSISDPSKIVERDVPENDVVAYEAAGYVKGGLPKDNALNAVVDLIEDAVETKPKAKATSKKK